jgi:hypothetical protein
MWYLFPAVSGVPFPLTLMSYLLLVFPPVSLLLLGSPDISVVSCTTVDPAFADVLNADCIPGVPVVDSVSAVAAAPILWTSLLQYVFSTFFLSLLFLDYRRENKLSMASSVNVSVCLKFGSNFLPHVKSVQKNFFAVCFRAS